MTFKIPTTVVGFVLFNVFVLVMNLFDRDVYIALKDIAFAIPLPSGAIWSMAFGDIFVCYVMLSVFMEIIRQASGDISQPGTHMIALAVFVISLNEFLLIKSFGHSYFFIFLLAALIDFVVTWLSTIIRARRDVRLTGGGGMN